MTPETLVGLLAEPTRMRVFAAVVLGASTISEVVSATDLTVREVMEALRRLARAGVVTPAEPFVAHVEAFKHAARTTARDTTSEPLDADRARAAVLRAFMVGGRLAAIPAVRGKRRIILEHICAAFEPGVRYPEVEVNAILRAWHADHAALRRYLVDEELMARDRGVYWRIGGPVYQ